MYILVSAVNSFKIKSIIWPESVFFFFFNLIHFPHAVLGIGFRASYRPDKATTAERISRPGQNLSAMLSLPQTRTYIFLNEKFILELSQKVEQLKPWLFRALAIVIQFGNVDIVLRDSSRTSSIIFLLYCQAVKKNQSVFVFFCIHWLNQVIIVFVSTNLIQSFITLLLNLKSALWPVGHSVPTLELLCYAQGYKDAQLIV